VVLAAYPAVGLAAGLGTAAAASSPSLVDAWVKLAAIAVVVPLDFAVFLAAQAIPVLA
jgi:hypothetical protein